MPANRLGQETSPYLRQHADNPVDWYPWGPEALARAKAEDKPLFVSIGYASCHWCHVMAHESFEDAAIATDLNRAYVAIKIDREERPDIDAIYMSAVQVMTGQGGWPMSVFCTPDGRPFFAGTYFPPSDRHGMPSFRRVLSSLEEAWTQRRVDVEAQADAVHEAIAREMRLVDNLAAKPPADERRGLLDRTVAQLTTRFDAEWGGFGPAPKFPRPTFVDLVLRHHLVHGDKGRLEMATTTLDAMAAGGMYDHLVGGFARYATDRRWLVPHFEKMLTDQVLLARAYLHAWQVTAKADYLQVATETLDYTLDALAAPGGGLCSSYDADAAGVEGGHATWTPREVQEALDAGGCLETYDAMTEWYGITPEGNWEGRTILSRPLGASLRRPADIERARQALAAARAKRPQPALDNKVLTEWNAMAVSSLAEASAITGREDWAGRAEVILDFLFAHLRDPYGRWLRSWQDGRAHHLALASDYAWVVDGCTRMAELAGQASWLARAVEVAGDLLRLFWDPGDDGSGAGLFTTGSDGETLIVRPKEILDGAVPSAHAVAAGALLRLGALTGEHRFTSTGERLVELGGPLLAEQPTAVADLVGPALFSDHGAEVVVAGERPDLLEVVRKKWLPDAVIAWGEPTGSPLWSARENGQAYVCHNFSCRAPTSDPEILAVQLDELATARQG